MSNKPLKLYANSIYSVPCNTNPELVIVNRAAEEELSTKLKEIAKAKKLQSFQHRIDAQYIERRKEEKQTKVEFHKNMDKTIKDLMKEAVRFSVETIKKKDTKVKATDLEKKRAELMKNTEAMTKKLQTSPSKGAKSMVEEEKIEGKMTRLQEIQYARKKLAMHIGKEEPPEKEEFEEQEIEPKVEITDNRNREGGSGIEIVITKKKKDAKKVTKKDKDKEGEMDPRDFSSITPVLHILGIDNYDKIKDMTSLKLNFDEADKYQKVWKINDDKKFAELLRFKIVQEIMGLEERRAVREKLKSSP